jgi:putative transposase
VDTLGLLLAVVVHAADIQDRDGAKLVLATLRGRFPRLAMIWADSGYRGKLVDWAVDTGRWVIAIVAKPHGTTSFTVLPRRWVVERTFAWLSKCRGILVRYDKDDENYLGLIQFACALYWYRRLDRLGRSDANQNPT